VASFPITLIFRDGETTQVDCRSFETVVQSAARQGVRLLTDCREGGCGTCKATIQTGQYSLDDYSQDALPDTEHAAARILTCRLRPESACVIEFDYPLSAIRRGAPPASRLATITAIGRLSDDVIEATIEARDGKPFSFLPGQYANLAIPDTDIVRSYSFVSEPHRDQATFLVRLLQGGGMSEWLQRQSSPGATMLVAGPYGRFFLRDPKRPLLFVAGGTGIGPIVSMLDSLKSGGTMPPGLTLVFGVNSTASLFYRDRLEALRDRFPNGRLVLAIMTPDPDWEGVTGTAVDALETVQVNPAAHVYLCGPPIMVERAQSSLERRGFDQRAIFAESFLPTSDSKAA
jgi:benzoate/toluate 1,2-dioxygenase reductase component